MISGMVAAYMCTPMDVVKTRLQHQLNSKPIPVLMHLLKHDGMQALFRGGKFYSLAKEILRVLLFISILCRNVASA